MKTYYFSIISLINHNISLQMIPFDDALDVSVQLVCENHDPNVTLRTSELIVDSNVHIHLTSKVEEIFLREPYVAVRNRTTFAYRLGISVVSRYLNVQVGRIFQGHVSLKYEVACGE